MQPRPRGAPEANLVALLGARETNARAARRLGSRFQFTAPLLRRLGLERELDGHLGCVNCLEWSRDGRVLASGSDDTHVRLWDPFLHRCLNVVQTSHIGNIFSVKFLGDGSLIATCAGDCRVIVKSIEDSKGSLPHIDCGCHMNRVKRLARCPDQPLLFWSASEDGLSIQYDVREPHKCNVKSRVFVDLSGTNELKCIAVNPTRPHLIAIGANDCYVRMYDRRMVKTTKHKGGIYRNGGTTDTEGRKRAPPEHQDGNCVQYFAPGHLVKETAREFGNKYAATYVSFNSSGSELLVNLGGEHIYLFDINNQRHTEELRVPEQFLLKYRQQKAQNGKLSPESVLNSHIDNALKLSQRNWVGDTYQAARYYLLAVEEDPCDPDRYLALINCLARLKWPNETQDWLDAYKEEFPGADPSLAWPVERALDEMRAAAVEGGGGGGAGAGERAAAARCECDPPAAQLTERERELRRESRDFELRFVGHCNTTTDIKEANFLGEDGNFVCAGSDDGLIFIWDRKSMEVLVALTGDNSIVNCVQPHPSACFLASSGIDPAVKLWAPKKEDGKVNPHKIQDPSRVIEVNQQRMYMDPFETMLGYMGYRVREGISDGSSLSPTQMCRAS